MADVCLAVFCRQPRSGVGKQRLAAAVGAESAYRIAAALWQCVREDLSDWAGDIALAVAEGSETEWAQREADSLCQTSQRFTKKVRVLAQPPGNLGVRLQSIDRELRAYDIKRVLFIGSDAPGLDVKKLTDIAATLHRHDVALAPAADGGVVAMAARVAWPMLEDLPWSTPTLGQALRDRCHEYGLTLATTQPSFDVDTVEDLPVALAALRDDPRPARRALCDVIRTIPLVKPT